MPKRRAGGAPAQRAALLHAIAHIELNALDLAWDIIARFTPEAMPREYYDHWVAIAAEEAKHYALLAARLAELGAAYGDFAAHDGLWQAAQSTSGDLLARLAVVPLVLEARGLDVTPPMIERFESFGDHASAAVLQVIHDDEIGHVRAGLRWFQWLSERRGVEPVTTYHRLVRVHFTGRLKPPFNRMARDAAGLPAIFYEALAAS